MGVRAKKFYDELNPLSSMRRSAILFVKMFLTCLLLAFAVATDVQANQTPIGCLDVVTSDGVASGWALDPDAAAQSVDVHFYLDRPAGQGTFIGFINANLPRPDLTGYPGNHGFNFPIPSQYRDGRTHSIYAYGIDTAGGTNPVLSGSPKQFTLSSPPGQSVTILMALPSNLTVSPGHSFTLTYNWQGGPTAQSWTVLVHFVNGSGQVVFQGDHQPSPPTTQWSGNISYNKTVIIPYSVAPGSYRIMAGFYNATGARLPLNPGPGVIPDDQLRYQIGTVSVIPDTIAPVVSISPLSPISGVVPIRVNASDNMEVTRVELYVDGGLRGMNNGKTDSIYYSFDLDTLQLADGSHTLLAKAYDYAGNVGQNSISVSVLNGGSKRAFKMEPIGLPEKVFDWSSNRCEDNDIPDLPARAFRDSDGRVNLLASHAPHSYRMLGDSLNSVARSCSMIMSAREDANFGQCAYQEWLAAPYTLDGQTIYSLVHNEWYAYLQPGSGCNPINPADGWVNSITLAVSNDKGAHYSHPAEYIVLRPSVSWSNTFPCSQDNPTRYGMFMPTNIIKNRDDNYYYVMYQSEAAPNHTYDWGVCLMRTQQLDKASSWEVWTGGGWDNSETAICAPIERTYEGGGSKIEKMHESLTYNTFLGGYLLIGNKWSPWRGIYFSFSKDLKQGWNDPVLIFPGDGVWYPSLLDPNDTSRNFEFTGQEGYIYYTQFNERGLDRDLMRQKARFVVTDDQPPAVSITSPANGSTVSGTVNVSANPSDNLWVHRVEFYVDATLKATDPSPSYSFDLDTTQLVNGSHTIMAKAYDVAGNSAQHQITVNVNNPISPTITYQASADFSSTQGYRGWYYLDSTGAYMTFDPANNWWKGVEQYLLLGAGWGHPGNGADAVRRWKAPQGGTMRISGNARDADPGGGDGVMVSIRRGANILWQQVIENGNTVGFNFDLTATVAAGEAIDFVINKRGNNYYDSTYFDPTIVLTPGPGDSTPPTVSITSPTNGATVSGVVNVTANASDNVGVAKVEFYVDTTLKATDTSSPYSFALDTTQLSNSSHIIMAKSYDAAGNSAQHQINVNVNNSNCQASVPGDRWKGEYYTNKSLSGNPSMVRDDGTGFLDFNWGSGSPSSSCGIGADNFSVRWTRTINFSSGNYPFTVTADDGVRLWMDNSLILDKWFDQAPTTYTVGPISLPAGNHTIRMEYYENAGGAVAKLSWQGGGTSGSTAKGFHDSSNCTASYGWTCDADDYSQAIEVHFYKDGPVGGTGVFIGSTLANQTREAAVGAECGGNLNHGFVFNTPDSLKDGQADPIYAYAINLGPAGVNPVLSGSPKTINCSPPQPPQTEILFGPMQTVTGNYGDYFDLFTKPDLWPNARRLLKGFMFYDLTLINPGPTQFLQDLLNVQAFSRLKAMGLDIVLGTAAIKHWECNGAEMARRVTLPAIDAIQSNGGKVTHVAFEEPYCDGTSRMDGITPLNCGYSIDQAAAETGRYVQAVKTRYPDLLFGDVEPYPHFRVDQLKNWILTLKRLNVPVSFFHLDVDLAFADQLARDPTVNLNIQSDLAELKSFFQAQNIHFGVILIANRWNATNDQEFYESTMEWIRVVRDSMGIPPQIIVESWIPNLPAMNLPENSTNYPFTRLINDGWAAFNTH